MAAVDYGATQIANLEAQRSILTQLQALRKRMRVVIVLVGGLPFPNMIDLAERIANTGHQRMLLREVIPTTQQWKRYTSSVIDADPLHVPDETLTTPLGHPDRERETPQGLANILRKVSTHLDQFETQRSETPSDLLAVLVIVGRHVLGYRELVSLASRSVVLVEQPRKFATIYHKNTRRDNNINTSRSTDCKSWSDLFYVQDVLWRHLSRHTVALLAETMLASTGSSVAGNVAVFHMSRAEFDTSYNALALSCFAMAYNNEQTLLAPPFSERLKEAGVIWFTSIRLSALMAQMTTMGQTIVPIFVKPHDLLLPNSKDQDDQPKIDINRRKMLIYNTAFAQDAQNLINACVVKDEDRMFKRFRFHGRLMGIPGQPSEMGGLLVLLARWFRTAYQASDIPNSLRTSLAQNLTKWNDDMNASPLLPRELKDHFQKVGKTLEDPNAALPEPGATMPPQTRAWQLLQQYGLVTVFTYSGNFYVAQSKSHPTALAWTRKLHSILFAFSPQLICIAAVIQLMYTLLIRAPQYPFSVQWWRSNLAFQLCQANVPGPDWEPIFAVIEHAAQAILPETTSTANISAGPHALLHDAVKATLIKADGDRDKFLSHVRPTSPASSLASAIIHALRTTAINANYAQASDCTLLSKRQHFMLTQLRFGGELFSPITILSGSYGLPHVIWANTEATGSDSTSAPTRKRQLDGKETESTTAPLKKRQRFQSLSPLHNSGSDTGTNTAS